MTVTFLSTANDHTAALQQAISSGHATIGYQPMPYVVSAPLTLPAGGSVLVEAGVTFQWAGRSDLNGHAIGLFEMADRSVLACTGHEGSTFMLRATTPTPKLVVARGRAVTDVKVVGAVGSNCNHVNFSAPDGTVYADVVTPDMATAGDSRPVNVCRDITIIGGGCSFDSYNGDLAGCGMNYTYDFEVRDCRWSNTYAGVQFWGGDSGLKPNQQGSDLSNPRKCKSFVIHNCTLTDAGAGIWGSFGEDFTISDCRIYRVSDVGFDYEGCTNGRIVGCYAEDCQNGNYTTFAYSIGITFEACSSRQSKRTWPLFRTYNVSQLPLGRDIVWKGGHLECTDPDGFASVDMAFGCVRSITIEGATLVNAVIALSANNANQVVIRNNFLNYTIRYTTPTEGNDRPTAFSAISAGGANQYGSSRPLVVIDGNVIHSEVVQPAGTLAVSVRASDFNGVPFHHVTGNTVQMATDTGSAAMKAAHVGGNSGLVARFVFEGNLLDGQIQTTSAGAAAPGLFKAINCYNEMGEAVGLTNLDAAA